jgi:hypothetical protein
LFIVSISPVQNSDFRQSSVRKSYSWAFATEDKARSPRTKSTLRFMDFSLRQAVVTDLAVIDIINAVGFGPL